MAITDIQALKRQASLSIFRSGPGSGIPVATKVPPRSVRAHGHSRVQRAVI